MTIQRLPGVKTSQFQIIENQFLEGTITERPLPSYYTLSFDNDPDFLLDPIDGVYPETVGYYDGIKIPDAGLTTIMNDAPHEQPAGTVYKCSIDSVADYLVDPSNLNILQIILHKHQDEHVLNQTVNRIAIYTDTDQLMYVLHILPIVWGTGELIYTFRVEYLSAVTLEDIKAGDIDKLVMADARIAGIAENIAKLKGLMGDASIGTTIQKNQNECTDIVTDLPTLTGKVHVLDGNHQTGSMAINDVELSFSSNAFFDLENASVLTIGVNTNGKIKVINAQNDSIIITNLNFILEIETDNIDCLDLSQLVSTLILNGKIYKGAASTKDQELLRKKEFDDAITTQDAANTAHDNAIALKAPIDSPAFTNNPTAPTQASTDNSKKLATTEFVTNRLAHLNIFTLKGEITNCDTNPNFPAGEAGDVWVITTNEGKIGGAAGVDVENNDTLLCIQDGTPSGDYATVGQYWVIGQVNLQPELFALLTGAAFTGDITITGGNLDCDGTITAPIFDGEATSALLADLAEMYTISKPEPPGTIVALSDDDEYDLTIAKEIMDTFGIVSTKPGFLMDKKLPNGIPICMVGKIPVRIVGPVKKKDRIVLAYDGIGRGAIPGEEPYSLGKALESNANSSEKLVQCSVFVRR